MRLPRLVLLASLVLAVSAHAEQVYVSDKLVANLSDTAGADGKRVTTVESGDALEVLERVEGFVRVRTDHGNEGWIKSSYLVSQPTAALRLKELESQRGVGESGAVDSSKYTQEIAQLQDKNKALDAEVVLLKKAVEEANAKIALTAKEAEASQTLLPTSTSPSASSPMQAVDQSTGMSDQQSVWTSKALTILAILVIVAGGVGFLTGYRTLAGRIRKKYGRVKIY